MVDPIDLLLVESDMGDDDELRGLLAELKRDATSVRPMPSAELAALMVPARPRSAIRRHRGLVTAVIVIGTLGVGATAAAASPEVRAAAHQVFQAVTGVVLPGTNRPAPHGDTSAPASTPTPLRSHAEMPHPTATDHPGRGDHPGNGATNAATPDPASSHDPGAGRATPDPTPGDPGNGHKP
jgi:hypothetical protein